MRDCLVRYYRPEDRQAVIDLWQRVFPDDPPHNNPAAVLDAKLEVDDLVFVAEIGQKIIGACIAGYDGHRGWLYAVAVNADFRRGGIGKALVEYAINELRQRGCIKLNLQIRADNHEVASFYRALGFEVEDRLSMGLLFQ